MKRSGTALAALVFLLFSLMVVQNFINAEEGKPSIGVFGTSDPVIMSVNLTSDLPDHPTGGYLGTEFQLLVDYLDADNDPPGTVLVTFDAGTVDEVSVNITSMELNPLDDDHTDGKLYLYEFQGWEIGEIPHPHDIMVTASEVPSGNRSDRYYLNDTLFIWDDDPVRPNPSWTGPAPIQEDSGPHHIRLEGGASPFIDPERSLSGAMVRVPGSMNWTDELDLGIARVSIELIEGAYYLNITPGSNEYGEFDLEVSVSDEHTTAVRTFAIVIEDVVDLPYFDSVIAGGRIFNVTMVSSLRYEVQLFDLEVLEDETFEFRIVAYGSNGEPGMGSVYERTMSDPWDNDPDHDLHGNVSLLPTENDVQGGSSLMVWTIERDGDDVRLYMYINLTGVNDPPWIMIPTTTQRTYDQFDQIIVRPVVSDPDRGDTRTFSCNVVRDLDSGYGPLSQQLPYVSFNETDWEQDRATGEVWIPLDDQMIWMTDHGSVQSVEITLVINVTDSGGENASASIDLILRDVNQAPTMSGFIYHEPFKPSAGQPVVLWVDEAQDPDLDDLEYRWDLGDGTTAAGRSITHIYYEKGWKTVQVWVEDGMYPSDKVALRIEITDDGGSIWLDQDSDGDGVKNRYDSFPDDPAASEDTDGDGFPETWNSGQSILDSTTGLHIDMFPGDASEWKDTDGDGRGDNRDMFPSDPGEWKDTDGDGIGDNSDRFPDMDNDSLRTIVILVSFGLILLILLAGFLLLILHRTGPDHGDEE